MFRKLSKKSNSSTQVSVDSAQKAAKEGWLLRQSRFLGKTRQTFLKLDEFSEYVQMYSNDPALGPKFSKSLGYFSLEGATLEKSIKQKRGQSEYKLEITTLKNKKQKFTAGSQADCEDWLRAFSASRDQATPVQALVEDWAGLECRECVQPIIDTELDGDDGETYEDIPEVWSVPVQDKQGRQFPFGNILRQRATVVLLLRHFGCMLCRHAAGKMMALKPFFDSLGISLVAVGSGTPYMARAFIKEQGFQGEIYVDQSRNLYRALNCKRGLKYNLHRRTMAAGKAAVAAGYSQGPTQGDLLQLGGVFVVTNNFELIFEHTEQYAGHHADLDSLQEAVLTWHRSIDSWSSVPRLGHYWNSVPSDLAPTVDGYFSEIGSPDVYDENPFIEDPLLSTRFYTDHFLPGQHVNFFAASSPLGPVCISVQDPVHYPTPKAIVRCGLGTVRLQLHTEDYKDTHAVLRALLSAPVVEAPDGYHFLDQVPVHALANTTFRQVDSTEAREDLLEIEAKDCNNRFKFGVLWVRPGQTTEREYYGNGHPNDPLSPEYFQFLKDLGEEVPKPPPSYLSSSGASPENELLIRFHIAAFLPYDATDPQFIERKRHIGNDVVVVVFLDPGAVFDPSQLVSHFNHVFIVVRKWTEEQTEKKSKKPVVEDLYQVVTIVKGGVPAFPPYLPLPSLVDGIQLRQWIIAKAVNGERAAYCTSAFRPQRLRTNASLVENIVSVALRGSRGVSVKPSRRSSSSTKWSSIAVRSPRFSSRGSIAGSRPIETEPTATATSPQLPEVPEPDESSSDVSSPVFSAAQSTELATLCRTLYTQSFDSLTPTDCDRLLETGRQVASLQAELGPEVERLLQAVLKEAQGQAVIVVSSSDIDRMFELKSDLNSAIARVLRSIRQAS